MGSEAQRRRRRGRPPGRCRLLVVVAALAVSTLTLPARANDEDGLLAAMFAVLTAIDVGYGIHDLVMVSEQRTPSEGAAASEVALAGTQLFVLTGGMMALTGEGDGEAALILTIPTMVTAALTAHGSWVLAQPDAAPTTRVVGSTLIGINQVWTSYALGYAVQGKLPPPYAGAAAMATSVPSFAISMSEFLRDDGFRSGWLMLSITSGALFAHGAAGLIAGVSEGDEEVMAQAPSKPAGSPWLPTNVAVAPLLLSPLDQANAVPWQAAAAAEPQPLALPPLGLSIRGEL